MPAIPAAALAWTAIGTSVAGAGFAAYSTYEAGQQSAAIARYNQQQQMAQSQATLQATAAKSLAERDQNQKILAQQQAAFAASGVVANTGSPLTVETKQAGLLERRALNTDYSGAIQSRFQQSAAIGDEMQGQAAKQAGDLGAAGTILQGAGNAASAYYKTMPAGGSKAPGAALWDVG